MGSTIVLATVILVILTSLLRFIIPCYSIFCTIFFIELVSFAAIFGQLENRYFHFSSLIYKYFIYVECFVGLYIVSNGFFFGGGGEFLCQFKVETCVSQLELIAKGDIVGAKILEADMPSETLYSDDSDGSQYDDVGHSRQQGWTSLQFTEATSVLKKFLKPRSPACKNCEAKNPAISKPTFGWFHMVSLLMSLQLEDCP